MNPPMNPQNLLLQSMIVSSSGSTASPSRSPQNQNQNHNQMEQVAEQQVIGVSDLKQAPNVMMANGVPPPPPPLPEPEPEPEPVDRLTSIRSDDSDANLCYSPVYAS